MTPLSGAAGDETKAVLLLATSTNASTRKDAVKAVTTCAPAYQPDWLIYNGTAYIGDSVYNTTGAGQTYSASVANGASYRYCLRLYNDGNVPDTFKVTGPAGNNKWSVKYVDYVTGADITAAVTGGGWTTPALKGAAFRYLNLYVTPGPSATVGEALSVLLTATSVHDGTKKDAAKATTTRG